MPAFHSVRRRESGSLTERNPINTILQNTVAELRQEKKNISESINIAKQAIKTAEANVKEVDKAIKTIIKIGKSAGIRTPAPAKGKTTKKTKKKTKTKTKSKGSSPKPIKPGSNTALVLDVVKTSKKALTAAQVCAEIDGLTLQNVYNILSSLDKRGHVKTNGKRPAGYLAT